MMLDAVDDRRIQPYRAYRRRAEDVGSEATDSKADLKLCCE
jgi:hypothetical protein